MYRRHLALLAASVISLLSAPAFGAGNLLRNGTFQDDWITRLTEVRTFHYSFSVEHFNRRDYNPDGWECRGSWEWLNADASPGQRRMIVRGPKADLSQRVNWVLMHDEKSLGGFGDAGRFPNITPLRSQKPLAMVRDLTFRVRLRGKAVGDKAGSLELGLCPPGDLAFDSPFGSITAPTVIAKSAIPAGTYDWQWVEVKLPAAKWLAAAPGNAHGPQLPGTARVTMHYKGAGEVEIGEAVLEEAGPASPNLLANGAFEELDAKGYPTGWSESRKFSYFPPGMTFQFNTWHNSTFENRGSVETDNLIAHSGSRSLKMIVPAGDEKFVASKPILLNQTEPRLVEVQALVKTDHLCTLQIDADDESGRRLDGMLFIHKAPLSIGTDDWRLVRQVFAPRQAVQSLQIRLCARGINGYTLDDTSSQPQNVACGTIWWDDIQVFEPESTAAELAARGVKPAQAPVLERTGDLQLNNVSLGEQLIGKNTLRASLFSPGPRRDITVKLTLRAPSGKQSQFSVPATIGQGKSTEISLSYVLEACPNAYTEYHGTLALMDAQGSMLGSTALWLGSWTAPIDLQLGNLYLTPQQKSQFVRMNFGMTSETMRQANNVRLDLIQRGTNQGMKSVTLSATPEALAAQRMKIPNGLRGDFANILLTDLDVSPLPVQPFDNPQRSWFLRATLLDIGGKLLATTDSTPFCRMANEPRQLPVKTVSVEPEGVLVNGKPWMPWGAAFGFHKVYDGPADASGKYFDVHNLPAWNVYDRFTSDPLSRSRNDLNALRYLPDARHPPGIAKKVQVNIDKAWNGESLYASTLFVMGVPLMDPKQLDGLGDTLAYLRTAPMAVAVAPGIATTFSLFTTMTPEHLQGLKSVADNLRAKTGKPVMIGHGGYWNRFEFEKVPFFDIYDPDTQCFYPANLHTDLQPLIAGQNKTVWLRPQIFEDVPYERWRFHTFVELIRGCRGWQFAWGPGDQSLFRGLHAEVKALEPALYSKDRGPEISLEPGIEHFSRRANGKTYLVAATTHGMTLGTWRWTDERDTRTGRAKITEHSSVFRSAANSYGTGAFADVGPRTLGIENLPDARVWPTGSKLVQWVKLDAQNTPQGLVVLAKADGRWTAAGQWGQFDLAKFPNDKALSHWFLSLFYRNAQGFAFSGWYGNPLPFALTECVPAKASSLGTLPGAGRWVKLEIPLAALGAEGKLVDGFAFLHENGSARWGRTSLVTLDGKETIVWGDQIGAPPESLAKSIIKVPGLKAGTKVKVLFENRDIAASDGFFTDDFRGQDLYQRFGGGPNDGGYGNTPVALHIYEIPL